MKSVDPQFVSAWFQPLCLSSDFLVSKFAFKRVNLCRYCAAVPVTGDEEKDAKAGLYSF